MLRLFRRAWMLWGLIALLIGLAPTAYAQDAPPVVQDALAALSAQVGTTLKLTDLNSWTWEQRNFPDTSLGCPRQGYTYAPVLTSGYIVTFSYNNVFYDYRVSADRKTLFLCTPTGGAPGGTPGPGAAPNTPIPPVPAVATESSAPVVVPVQSSGAVVCPGGLPTRLAVGMKAKSIATGSINIRSATTLTDPQSVIGLLLPGGQFDVVGGPLCADNRTWWQISYDSTVGNTTGWIIEGDNVEYWLAPVGSAPVPGGPSGAPSAANRAPITAANAAQVRVASQFTLPQNLIHAAFMPPPSSDALLSMGQTADYYTGSTFQRLNLTLGHPGQVVVGVATAPKDANTAHVASLERNTSSPGGGMLLYISEIAPGAVAPVLSERIGFQLPFDANDLAFSVDGRWLAVTSGSDVSDGSGTPPNGFWVWDTTTGAQVTAQQLNSAAHGVVFSPDGRLMAISAPVEGTYLWDTATWSQIVLLPGEPCLAGSSCLAFSPDSRLLAVGTQNTGLQLWDVTTNTLVRSFTPPIPGAVAYVAFTPDSTVLATGVVHFQNPSRNTSIYLWDAASGTQLAFLADYNDFLVGLVFRAGGRELITVGQRSWWSWGVY
jgi:hypothetical protein